jgi:hypothetical protein
LRREGDSNPRFRDSGTTVFETAAFDHSAISPLYSAAFATEFIQPRWDHLTSPGLLKLTKIIHISFDNSFLWTYFVCSSGN